MSRRGSISGMFPAGKGPSTTLNASSASRESLYVLLLNKREENSLALAATEDNARMVDGVRGGNGPLEPNVPKILMVGFLAGMAIPVFLCVVAAMLDSSVKRRKEIETLTSIPVYGELPRKPRKLKNQEIVVNLEEPSELSECFPLLAERMVALSDGNGGNPLSVLITSTCSGEGKTYLSVNLALSLAVAGKKVLLMDMDLRKGALSAAGRSRKAGPGGSGAGRGGRLAFPGGTIPRFRPPGLPVCGNRAGPSLPAFAA